MLQVAECCSSVWDQCLTWIIWLFENKIISQHVKLQHLEEYLPEDLGSSKFARWKSSFCLLFLSPSHLPKKCVWKETSTANFLHLLSLRPFIDYSPSCLVSKQVSRSIARQLKVKDGSFDASSNKPLCLLNGELPQESPFFVSCFSGLVSIQLQ